MDMGLQSMKPPLPVSGLYLQAVKKQGLGVFVKQPILNNSLVLTFTGVVTSSHAIRDFTHFLQIAPDLYLAPSGQLDDYVNHSCEPNCAVYFEIDNLVLRAIRDIDAGEQLSFDYGTIMFNEPTRFDCSCGSLKCRRHIGNFFSLPSEIQNGYLQRGMAPLLTRYRKEELGF